VYNSPTMRDRSAGNFSPRIANRKAMHDYFIIAKIECGIVLLGSEVKSLRYGRCQLAESFARIDGGELILHGCHIDPYEKAAIGHLPLREKKLLVHKRELHKLEGHTAVRGVTLIPLAIYFKDGRAKLELGVARGKHEHDKRQSIKRKEQDREMRRAMTHRQ
jgi:SsrA-binding protein